MSYLPRKDALVLLHNYTTGSFRDHGPLTSNDGTPPATGLNWVRSGSVVGFVNGRAIKMTVPHHTSLNLPNGGTFLRCSLDGMSNAENAAMCVKSGEYAFDINAGGTIRFWTSTGWRTVVYDPTGDKTLCAVAANGTPWKLYADGVYINSAAVNTSFATTANILYLANQSAGNYGNSFPQNVYIIWDAILSDVEVAAAHQWCMEQASPTHRKTFWNGTSFPSRVTGREPSCIGAWCMENLANGKVADSTGNGHTATLTGFTQLATTELGRATLFDGVSGYLSVADANDLSFGDGTDDTAFSISALIKMVDATEFPILAKGVYNTDAEYRLLVDAADKIHFQTFDESVADCYIGRMYNTALTAMQGKWLHIVATYSAVTETSADFTIYLNGVAVDDADSELNAGSYDAMEPLAGDVHLGRNDTLYADGAVRQARLWSKELSATEVQELYLTELATLPTFVDDLSDANVSVADESGVGNYLSNTNWRQALATGIARIAEDPSGMDGAPVKCINNQAVASVSKIYTEYNGLYGTFEFDIKKVDGADDISIVLADSMINGDIRNGYAFVFDSGEKFELRRYVAGGVSDIFRAVNLYFTMGQWYTIRVTRSFAGEFTFYAKEKGGSWELIPGGGVVGTNPMTDTINTVCEQVIIRTTRDDSLVTNFRFYQGVLDPT